MAYPHLAHKFRPSLNLMRGGCSWLSSNGIMAKAISIAA